MDRLIDQIIKELESLQIPETGSFSTKGFEECINDDAYNRAIDDAIEKIKEYGDKK